MSWSPTELRLIEESVNPYDEIGTGSKAAVVSNINDEEEAVENGKLEKTEVLAELGENKKEKKEKREKKKDKKEKKDKDRKEEDELEKLEGAEKGEEQVECSRMVGQEDDSELEGKSFCNETVLAIYSYMIQEISLIGSTFFLTKIKAFFLISPLFFVYWLVFYSYTILRAKLVLFPGYLECHYFSLAFCCRYEWLFFCSFILIC